MDKVLQHIKNICQQNLLCEKILIMPSYSEGWQLLHAAAAAGANCINFKVHTLEDLCFNVCSTYLYEHKIDVADTTLCWHYMMEVLEQLKRCDRLEYFNRLKITPDISKLFYNAILDLKMAGVMPETLHRHHFISDKKYIDIKNIYIQYQDILSKRRKMDTADLYRLAIGLCDGKQKPIYIIADNIRFNYVQKCFLNALTGGKHLVLSPGSDAGTNYARVSMDVFTAHGEISELIEIIRRVKHKGVPFEQVAVHCTNTDYIRMMVDICTGLDIPITCATGLDIKCTKPGKLMYQMLDWIQNQYAVHQFCSILYNRNINLGDIDCFKAAYILRNAGIIWGRDRYISCLAELKHEQAQQLLYVFKNIFNLIPQTDQNARCDYSRFAKGMADIIKDYSCIYDEKDEQARDEMIRRLYNISQNTDWKLDINDTIQMLKSALSDIRVGASSPKPGCMHVASFQKGIWTNRHFNFIVGMDSDSFPGRTEEDAVLLDSERRRISPYIKIKSTAYKENIKDMQTLLANLKGQITISCCVYDIHQNTPMFPSSYMNDIWQHYRAVKQDDSLPPDVHANLCSFIPQHPQDVIDQNEWWLYTWLKDKSIIPDYSVINTYYPSLSQGIKAYLKRTSPKFTEYDGNVQVEEHKWDPRHNKSLIMSCAKIEQLAACPYAFFLKYILGLYPDQQVSCSPQSWLDPLNRGLLLHDIFAKFMAEYVNNSKQMNIKNDDKLMYELADELIADYKNKIPPLKQAVFYNERKEIYDSCTVFLKSEYERLKQQRPCHLELSFGEDTNPVSICLPSGKSFYLSGRIDRVDKTHKGELIVLDYKTGRCINSENNDCFMGGRQIQHALYSMAVQSILSQAEVKSGGYVFPTVKGEGECVIYPQDKNEHLFEILDALFDILAYGLFIMTEDNNDCNMCEYAHICRRQDVCDVLADKAADSSVPELECVRRVKRYESNKIAR